MWPVQGDSSRSRMRSRFIAIYYVIAPPRPLGQLNTVKSIILLRVLCLLSVTLGFVYCFIQVGLFC